MTEDLTEGMLDMSEGRSDLTEGKAGMTEGRMFLISLALLVLPSSSFFPAMPAGFLLCHSRLVPFRHACRFLSDGGLLKRRSRRSPIWWGRALSSFTRRDTRR